MSVKTHSTMKKQYNNTIPGCFHPGFFFCFNVRQFAYNSIVTIQRKNHSIALKTVICYLCQDVGNLQVEYNVALICSCL